MGVGLASLVWAENGPTRPAFSLVLLALLGVSFEARSEEQLGAASAAAKCSAAADAQHWTKQEIFAWERVCAGAIADFNEGTAYGGKLDPSRPEGLPESRILRSKFLEIILLDDKYRSMLPRRGVRIIGARFSERVDLVNAELKHELWLNNCLLEQGADFSGAKATHLLSFDGSTVTGAFTANWSRIDESLFMRDARFADIEMGRTHIGGTLELTGSTVTGKIKMDKLHVDSSLSMKKGRFREVVLESARIGGTLELDGSTVAGKLDMDKLHVDSSLSMKKGQFREVVLGNARIGGILSLAGSKVTGRLDMDKLHVESSLFMREHAEFVEVVLRGAHIEGQLDMTPAKVTGNVECYNLTVDRDVLLQHAQFSGKIDCRFSKFKELFLNNSTFGGDVDLSGGQISGLLSLGPSGHNSARWSGGKALVLRNARAETIPMLTDAWPVHLDVNGFTYRALRDHNDKSGDDRITEWFEKHKSFSPQPYEQLALVIQNQGYADDARTIRYAGKERERSASSGLQHAWLMTLNLAIGYGHYIERAIIWTIVLVILGAIVLRISGEGPKHGLPVGLSYSFDMLLPVIKLRDAHYEIDLAGWPRYYFYGHKIAGFVLASFLVAGISGLTK